MICHVRPIVLVEARSILQLPLVDIKNETLLVLIQSQGTPRKREDVKGTIKEKIGRATNDPDLEDEGTAEKIGGKVQKKVGDVEKVFGR